jgi:hypothetical protein
MLDGRTVENKGKLILLLFKTAKHRELRNVSIQEKAVCLKTVCKHRELRNVSIQEKAVCLKTVCKERIKHKKEV